MMKSLIFNNKFHLCAIGIIMAIFIFSLSVRQKELNKDLSAQQEWITAHVLITAQIWAEGGGPSKFGFNPVYSYSGKGNKAIPALGGIQDEKGDMYYVSYPPFAFIAGYYGSQLLGGNDVYSIRAIGLIIHFFCAFFIYLIFKNLSSQKTDAIYFSGIIAAALYLLSAGTLWMHSTLFFSDMLVQPFIILSLLYFVKLYKSNLTNNKATLFALGLITFLGCYTEWLSVFLAFIIGLAFLVLFFIHKHKKFLHGFLIIATTSILSVTTTVLQYSTIAGFDRLVEVSTHKYEQRSGYENETISAAGYNLENPESYELLVENFNRNFSGATIIIGLVLILFLLFLFFNRFRNKIENTKLKIGLLSLLTIATLAHYLTFFNFNALHNFSNLKTGFLVILVGGLLFSVIEENLKRNYKWLFWAVSSLLLILIIPSELKRFHDFSEEPYFAHHLKNSAEKVKVTSNEETLVFSNMKFITTEYIYRSHHNIFALKDSSKVRFFMDYLKVDKADYYDHDKVVLQKIIRFERRDDVITVKSTVLNQAENSIPL